MTRAAIISTLLFSAVVVSSLAIPGQVGAASTNLICDVGPITKIFGRSQWLVYSCDDRRTVVVVSAPGNPAMPYYFTLSRTENGYRISGEGAGNRAFTAAAFSDLTILSQEDIEYLVEQTREN